MKTISGTIDSEDTSIIPPGSVIFIYIYNPDTKEVIGHQTLHNIESLPVEYKVTIDKTNFSNCAIRVTVENGELTLYAKDVPDLTLTTEDELHYDVELEPFSVLIKLSP